MTTAAPAGRPGPGWLAEQAPAGNRHELAIPDRYLGELAVTVWSPANLADAVPTLLLVVHDGPEYDRSAALTRYLAAGIEAGRLPPIRAALLAAQERDEWYSADDRYAATLAGTVLPELARRVATAGRIGMGTSLGALAMLHAQRRHGLFDGLFLQSGSFFQPLFDAQEQGFARYPRIIAFVGQVVGQPSQPKLPPTVLTCGWNEENLHNNRALAAALQRQGHDVTLREGPGGHDFTAWRDALHPPLTTLLASRA